MTERALSNLKEEFPGYAQNPSYRTGNNNDERLSLVTMLCVYNVHTNAANAVRKLLYPLNCFLIDYSSNIKTH